MVRLWASCILLSGIATAQSTDGSPGLDPAIQLSNQQEDTHILGVIPNYTTVPGLDAPVEPLSVKGKFKLAAQDSFDPYAWVLAGIFAGAAQWDDTYPEFGLGAQGYGKRYGGAVADEIIGNYMTDAIFPVLLHEDPRYYRLGQGSGWKRTGYALSRILITRTDAGGRMFNFTEIGGNGLAAALSNIYYSDSARNASGTVGKMAVNVATDAGMNILREFWPDLRRKLFRK